MIDDCLYKIKNETPRTREYYTVQELILYMYLVMGTVFENVGKNAVLLFHFRFFKTKNKPTSFRLVVLV